MKITLKLIGLHVLSQFARKQHGSGPASSFGTLTFSGQISGYKDASMPEWKLVSVFIKSLLSLIALLIFASCKQNDPEAAAIDYGKSPRTPVPAELISPTQYWQFGILSSTNFYDSYNSTYKDGAGGSYMFYDFNEDGTYTALLYLKATSSAGETRQAWTETKGTVVVGDTTLSNNITYKTIQLHPVTGRDRWVINYGSETNKTLTQQDFNSRTLLKAKFVCEPYKSEYGVISLDMLRVDPGGSALFNFHEER